MASARKPTTEEIVGDEKVGAVMLFLQLRQESQDGGLHRNIERGYRLVTDDQVWIGGESAGDGDALFLAAAQFIGVAFGVFRAQIDAFKQVEHFGIGVERRHATQFDQGAGVWFVARRDKGSRNSADSGRPFAAWRAHPALRSRTLLRTSMPSSSSFPPLRSCKPMMTRASVVLPLPLSADQAECLAGPESQVDAIDGANRRWLYALQCLAQGRGDREVLAQVGDAHEGVGG